MDATAIDHVNLNIPSDGLEDAIAFYESLGFEADRLDEYESGEKPFFSIRLTAGAVLHLWPDEEFTPPSGENYDHVAIRVADSIEEVKETLDAADIEIENEMTPLGATGTAPAVYVIDPFGYRVELKTDG